MGFRIADRVQETTTTTGTGTLTLAGAATGFQSFSVIGNGNQAMYAIIDSTNNVWEVGIGTYTSSGTTLSRDTIFSNSSGTTSALNLSAGTKTVICTFPAQPTITDTMYGYQAMYSRPSTGTSWNTSIGYQAGYSNSGANYCTNVGYQAGYSNSSGNLNTAIGYQALKPKTGIFNTGVGWSANGTSAFSGGDYNTAVGGSALATQYGSNATAVGVYASYSASNSADTTAVGYGALYTNGSGYRITAIGSNAGYYISGAGVMESVAIGYKALYGNSANLATGNYNTVVGSNTLVNASSATNNSALGWSALTAVTSGSNNVGVGFQAGSGITTSSSNVMIGYGAGAGVTTNSDGSNIAIGYQAGNGASGGYNINIGFRTMYTSAAGAYNINIGYTTSYSSSSGSYNVNIGGYQGSGGIIDITASSNNIVLGDNAGNILLYKVTSNLAGFNYGVADKGTSSGSAATGTINFDAATQKVLYYTGNATANFTINVRSTATVSLNSALPAGQSLTIQFLCTNGATPYYMSAFQIDGSSVTPKWITGTAPTAGNANSIDVYTLQIFKTGGAAFTVFARQDKYA